MTAMTKQLIDAIGSSPRGEVFLINLHYSIEHGLDEKRFLELLEDFGNELPVDQPLPDAKFLVEQMGARCAIDGLWLQCGVPDLRRFGATKRILSRMTTYGRFYRWILARPGEMPLPDVPDPIAMTPENPAEVLAADVQRVRQYIDANQWRSRCSTTDLRFDTVCNWMAPYDELARKIGGVGNPGDRCRDVVGLSHLQPGEHLIRIDVDLQCWESLNDTARRRPNCAANGGDRFLMPYDVPPACDWGRTVDLEVLAERRNASMNGVPELVMAPFSVPIEAISTQYVGAVTAPSDDDDAYFLSRVTHHPRFFHP